MNSFTNESEIKIIGVGLETVDLLTPAAKEAVEITMFNWRQTQSGNV